jgi:UDPglucose 6-dehydrogenase
MYKINIVGAGFVGLTLAEVLSGQDTVEKITVIDITESRINDLKEGRIPVKEADMTLKSDKIHYTSKYTEADGDIFFVCVGTPNNDKGEQITQYLKSAFANISEVNKRATFILKSTTLPENVESLKQFVDPIFGHYITNPEFMAEGKAVADLKNQDQLIIGTDEEDTTYAENLMKELFVGTYKSVSVIGLKEAMVVKYFLNSYKAQKLNFINDFNWFCGMHGLSMSQVLSAVNDPVLGKGFDKPGIGYGGSCFPKDTQAIGKYVASAQNAYQLNSTRIGTFARLLCQQVGEEDCILLGGKAFKNGTNDTRESVSIKVANILKANRPKAHIYFYDQLPELSDVSLDEIKENIDKFDVVVIFNDLPELAELFPEDCDALVYNTRSYE